MITFRCKRGGNTVSFTNEDDIKQMRSHEEYEEIKNDAKEDSNCTNDEATKESIVNCPSESKIESNGNEAHEGINEGRHDEGQKRSLLKKRGRPAKK